MVQIPAFCETEYFDNQMNQDARVVLLPQAEASRFADYCGLLTREGFAQRERRSDPYGEYAAFYKDGWGVFVNYFANSRSSSSTVLTVSVPSGTIRYASFSNRSDSGSSSAVQRVLNAEWQTAMPR